MKTEDIIEEFEDCTINHDDEQAIPFIEVYKHLKDLNVTFKVKNGVIGDPREIGRHIDIHIKGTLPATKPTQKKIDERKKESKKTAPPPGTASMGP